ncbi:MAG: hypothetical protein LQ341_000678 [Variospora aurantia]|nr:MAG: hypothetical protein LQ341_000678 [Variospora aurantia]
MSDGSESDHPEAFLKSHERAVDLSRTTGSEREEQLRRMMEDDEPVKTTASKSGSESQVPGSHGNIDQHVEETSPVSNATTGGRRRGRRKVMKKKMLKDEEGYLVTKEEPAWESFSEDEPPPKEVALMPTVSSTARGRKAAGMPGQGNIMSFFGKR